MLRIALAEPKPGRGHGELRRLPANVTRLELCVLREEGRRHGIEHRHREDAETDGDAERGCYELPGGHARGPGGDQLVVPRHSRESKDGAQQYGEGEELLGEIAKLQQTHA